MINIIRQRNNTQNNKKISTKFRTEPSTNFRTEPSTISENELDSIKKNFVSISKKDIDIHKFENINTLVFSSSEMYILSILGYIDKLIENNTLDLNNINTFVSSSLGTIVIVYLSFGYTPKDILGIIFEHFELKNDSIFNIYKTYGIFDTSYFIDKLLYPLLLKLGYIPTLNEIYKLTNKDCIFVSYCLNKSKVVTYSYKNHPDIKINELIKNCCVVPIFLKKNDNIHGKEFVNDIHIDYSFIDNREYKYTKSSDLNTLFFRVNIIDNKSIFYNKNTNFFDYLKQLISIAQNKVIVSEDSNYKNLINIDLNINSYEQLLLLDNEKRYKVLMNLYCYGYDVNFSIEINNENCTNIVNNYRENENNYQGIVIAGGGTNVFCLLGCIKYCLQNNIINLSNINVIIGTSAGSILAVILAMGFNFEEMIELYLKLDLNSKFNIDISDINVVNNINIFERINEKSIYSNKILLEMYEKVFIEKNNGIIPTLLDIKNKYNKELVFGVYNLTTNKLEYLNYLNSPDLLVTHGCAMSSCIPIVFNPIEYNRCFYIDGGMKENYPISATCNYSNINFIGFPLNFSSNYTNMNFIEYLIYFIFENARNNQDKLIHKSQNCKSYCFDIFYDNNRKGQNLFCVTQDMILDCINKGTSFMKNEFEKIK
jgi:predicted acylesterase/phospholipase RssA